MLSGFFHFLKDYDEPLWNTCTNHNKLLVITHVFTIKLDHKLIETGYDKIVKWIGSILPEKNIPKKNFYTANSIMKLLIP